MISGAIFDLDGVLVDTAKYHFIAWNNLANQLLIPFSEKENERLKGVSRDDSLEILLSLGNKVYSKSEKELFMIQKNRDYLKLIEQMSAKEVLPGVKKSLIELKKAGLKLAVGSSSKNAKTILKNVDLIKYFDEVIDGNDVKNAKPDPEVFLLAAKRIEVDPRNTVVFEDAHSGCLAAKKANMYCIGIGEKINLPMSDKVIKGMSEFELSSIFK